MNGGRRGKALRAALAAIALLAVLALAVSGFAGAGASSRLAQAQQQSASLRTQESKARAALAARQRQADAKARTERAAEGGSQTSALSGQDAQAFKTVDDAAMDRLFGTVLTWDSSASYKAARAKVQHDWRQPEDGDLLGRFMAPDSCKTSRNGNTYCLIDAQGMSSRYSMHDSALTGVHDGVRTYVGSATYLVPPVKGVSNGETRTRTAYFAWSMSGDGVLDAIQWIDAG